MRYIHSQGIIHRDLKPGNILLSRNFRALISDFGLTRFESKDSPGTGDTGTYAYAAPEQLDENSIPTIKLDVFAFGLVVYEIMGSVPVFGEGEYLLGVVKRLRSGILPDIPVKFGGLMRTLIPRCWSYDPPSRPSFNDIFRDLESAGFAILPRADGAVIRDAVSKVLEWQRSPR
jgi:serine/threonine protein kinase